MNAGEAIDRATEWVEVNARTIPGFLGAHLMGSIATLPRDAPFPPDTDLDIAIVMERAPEPAESILELWYRGIAIEMGLYGAEEYRSPEAILTHPGHACHLAANTILSDPTGLLTRLHTIVRSEYHQQQWVQARCEQEKCYVRSDLERAAEANNIQEFNFLIGCSVVNLSGLLAVATLQAPTHRKCLVLMRDVLHELGRQDLYEDTLAVCGFAHLTPSQVTSYLERSSLAFDRAVEVRRQPCILDFKLRPHLRPYLVDGPKSMISQGLHREAMITVGLSLYASTAALVNDAPEAERPRYIALMEELLTDLCLSEPDWKVERMSRVSALTGDIFRLADEIVGISNDSVRVLDSAAGTT